VGTLRDVAVFIVVAYAAVVALMWLAQERLQFHPQPAMGPASAPPGWSLEDVRFPAGDGTMLAGTLVRPAAARGPLVIYYGGNAEEVTAYAAEAASTYGERAVLLVNYRGYGASAGQPGEREMVADSIALYDWAARRADVDPERIVLHGRSLGTGVAVQVAAARPARCVILTSPFASAREVAAEIYPWAPIGMIMRHPFDSVAHAPRLAMPALFLVGEADTLIPPRYSNRLADAWGGRVERVSLAGFGHNDVSVHPGYSAAVQAFLARCL